MISTISILAKLFFHLFPCLGMKYCVTDVADGLTQTLDMLVANHLISPARGALKLVLMKKP